MICRFKVTIDGAKGFFREYELRGTQTLYSLHEHIVSDLDFAPDQMVLFRVEASNGKALKEYGLFDTGHGAIDAITMETLIRQKETTLLYVFDMRFDRFLRLRFVETDDELPRKSYPRTSDARGDAPSQFNNAASAQDDPEPEMPDEEDIEGLDIDKPVDE